MADFISSSLKRPVLSVSLINIFSCSKGESSAAKPNTVLFALYKSVIGCLVSRRFSLSILIKGAIPLPPAIKHISPRGDFCISGPLNGFDISMALPTRARRLNQLDTTPPSVSTMVNQASPELGADENEYWRTDLVPSGRVIRTTVCCPAKK